MPSQVKEVLVVQAKKDTSELVKKKEEVTQAQVFVRLSYQVYFVEKHVRKRESKRIQTSKVEKGWPRGQEVDWRGDQEAGRSQEAIGRGPVNELLWP